MDRPRSEDSRYARGPWAVRTTSRGAPLLAAAEGAQTDGLWTGPVVTGGDYVRVIRTQVGHSRIFYPWAGLALRDTAGRVFLVRAEIGQLWHCPGGGLELGERPEDAANRELEEETGLRATADGLVGCWSGRQMAYANGDRIQAIGMLLRGRLREASNEPTGLVRSTLAAGSRQTSCRG